jgi:hypothetical protein
MELRSVHAHMQDSPAGFPDEQVPRHLRVENPTWRRRADRPLQRLLTASVRGARPHGPIAGGV